MTAQHKSVTEPATAAPTVYTEAGWFKIFAAALLLIWTLVICLSFYFGYGNAHSTAYNNAIIQDRTAYQKDIVYRRWNSMNNIYAQMSNTVPANPFLAPYMRELPTEHGFTLTKINPAYMTRLVHELGALADGTIGHITSNDPIRSGNKADEWESSALTSLENEPGLKEVAAIQTIDGTSYMRFMGELPTEESCLSCHPDYIEGSQRGGISISVPMAPFLESANENVHSLAFSHFAIWLVGFGTILVGSRKMLSRISERDKAQNALQKLTGQLEEKVAERTRDLVNRQSLLQSFMDNTEAAVYMKNTQQQYIMVNKSMADLFGKKQEEFIGRASAVPGRPAAKQALEYEKTVLETKNGLNAELLITTAEGRDIHTGLFLFPILNSDRELEGVGGMIVDISQRKRIEESLLEAKNAAEKANRAKNYFLANISHEIRTPLNGVIGMADLLLRTRLNPDQISMASVIRNGGNGLLAVLNDVLDYSKIEAGKTQLEMLPFGLRRMLFDAIKGLAPIAYKKGLEIIVHIEPRVPDHLLGDKQRISQIILNLLNNAIKFTENGEVSLTVRQLKEDNHKTTLRVSVSDTGIGIAKDKQDQIFAAFVQADSSTTRKYGGTGLGLAISSKLAALMGSTLHLESKAGQGSTFWFDLELTRLDEDSASEPYFSEDGLKGYRAMVVDDNSTNRRIMLEQLGAWGMETMVCSSADEALSFLRVAAGSPAPISVVLTDMQMPDKNGLELLREIKADDTLKDIPVLLLSSGTPAGDDVELERFSARLSKPVNPVDLLQSLSSALKLWERMDTHKIHEEEQKKQESVSRRSYNVLLIEDMEMNQLVVSRMLTDLGHQVTVAGDGRQALELMAKTKYDIVFMDIQMPVMDGVAATKVIRQYEQDDPSKGYAPIVAMTAHAMKGDKEKYLELGMDSYISKPIIISELVEVIEEIAARFELQGHEATQSHAKPPQNADETNEAAESYLDPASLKAAFAGDESLTCQAMRIYLRDVPQMLSDIEKALSTGDNVELASKCHSLKSITGYYSTGRLYESCLNMEKAGRAGMLPAGQPALLQQMTGLKKLMDGMLRALRRYLEEHGRV